MSDIFNLGPLSGQHAPGTKVTGIDAYGRPVWSDQLDYISMVYTIDGVPHLTYAVNTGYIKPAPSASSIVQPLSSGISTVSVPAPPPPAPHLQFSPGTIGATTPMMIGRCRLAGQYIWAQGLSTKTDQLTSSLLTCAISYGEPIDPTESIVIQKMAANGTVFYDLAQGGVITLASLSATDLTQLRTCISQMKVYYGKEDQQPDPTMLATNATTPAYRGLRYIVLRDFPVAVSNNSVPNISIEWRKPGDALINVADVMVALAARRGASLSVSGIPDQCQGFVCTAQESLIQNLIKHRDAYNYQIVDGTPIKIKRRAVNSSLMIDLSLVEGDLVRNGGAVLAVNRLDPSTLPKGVQIQYQDSAASYDMKMQVSRYDGDGKAKSVIPISIDYVIDATTARVLAYETMFRMRAKAATILYEINDPAPEVGDVIEVTAEQGTIAALIEEQIYSKGRTNQVTLTPLLTSTGVTVDGTSGTSPPTGTILWPDDAASSQISAVFGGKVYACSNAGSDKGITVNDFATPARRIPVANLYADAVNFNNTVDAAEDPTYVYFLASGTANITILRINKTDFNDQTTIDFSAGAGSNPKQMGIYGGRLYVAEDYVSAGPSPMRLWILDLANFGLAGLSSIILGSTVAGHVYKASGLCIANGNVAIATLDLSSGPSIVCTLYIVNCATQAVSTLASTYPLGRGVGAGAFGYFLPANLSHDLATYSTTTQVQAAKLDPSAPSLTYFAITNDPNVHNAAHKDGAYIDKPWSDGTNFCFIANYDQTSGDDLFPLANQYLAKVNLSSLLVLGGNFLSQYFGGLQDFAFFNGAFYGGNNYLMGDGSSPFAGAVFLQLSQNLATFTQLPVLTPPPSNDNFASPSYIAALQTVTADTTYATKEIGEPNHAGNAGGHSVWWLFVPLISGDYTVDATSSSFHTLTGVYWGTSLTTLDTLGSADNATVTFYGRAGLQYMIAVDGKDGVTGSAALSVSDVTIIATDDDENFLMLIE